VKIAILDDYQHVALSMADWSAVVKNADITVFGDHVDQTDRKDTAFRRDLRHARAHAPASRHYRAFFRLRFVASTGSRNISIDMAAANERGIAIACTGYRSRPTIECRFCEPEDVAGAALYLASDDAAFINGVILEVEGRRAI
jgi:hypothetical protein